MIATVAAWFVGTKLGRTLLMAAAIVFAFGAWTVYARHAGYVKAQEQARAAAEAELTRVRGVLAEAQQRAQEAVAHQHQLEMSNAKLVAAARVARSTDGDGCLDAVDSSLLDAIRKPSPKRAQ